MKFFFCESCGKRITDADLDEGKGRDKKLKGVYCTDCAKGVMTMEMLPLNEEQARKILKKQEPKPEERSSRQATRGTSGYAIPVPVRSESGTKAGQERHAGKTPAAPIVAGIAAGLLGGGVLLLFLMNSGETPSSTAGNAAAQNRPQPAEPLPAPLTPIQRTVTEKKTPAVPAPVPVAEKTPEAPPADPARAAFEKMESFEGLAPDDAAGRVAALENFLKDYGTSQYAARAQTMLDEINNTVTSAVGKTEAEKTDVAQMEPAKTETAGDSGKEPPSDIRARPPPRKEGGGFKCEFFEGDHFEKLIFSRVEHDIVAPPVSGLPKTLTGKDGYSYRFTGYIEPPESGDYIFDAKGKGKLTLFLNEILVHCNYFGHEKSGGSVPIALEAGKKYLFVATIVSKNEVPELRGVKWRKTDWRPMLLDGLPPETKDKAPAVSDWCGGWKMECGKLGSSDVLTTRNEICIDWDYNTGAPGPERENFWIRWTGLITPPKTADYTFFIDADEGARVFINDILLIDTSCGMHGKFPTDPITLEGGKTYAMRIGYQDFDWVANCRLTWSAPGMNEEPVRASLPKGPPSGVLPPLGYLAEYWNDGAAHPQATRFERRAGTNWLTHSPDNAIKPENFNCRYTGWITPPADGDYTFTVKYDEGARLTIDDVVLFDWLNAASSKTETTTIHLLGGKHYFVKLEHRDITWVASLDFKWKSAEMSERYVTAMQPSAFKSRDKDAGHVDAFLMAEYTCAGKSAVKRLEGALWHCYGSENGPDPSFPKDGWSGKWTGGLKVEAAGNYVFKLAAENSGEMKFNRLTVIKGTAKGVESQPIPMQKGVVYPVEFSLQDHNWTSSIQLWWKPPGKTEFEPVPPGFFVPPPEASQVRRQAP